MNYDDYTNMLHRVRRIARYGGLEQLPFWRKIEENPAYDAFWQQALDRIMAESGPLKVPVMWLQGLWDQEDMWGAIHCYETVEPKDGQPDDQAPPAQPAAMRVVLGWGRCAGTAILRCSSAVTCRCPSSINEGWCAEGRHAAGIYLQHGRDPWDARWPLSCERGCGERVEASLSRGAGQAFV